LGVEKMSKSNKNNSNAGQIETSIIIVGSVLLIAILGGLVLLGVLFQPTQTTFNSQQLEKFSNYSELVAYFEKANSSNNYNGGMYREMMDGINAPMMATGAAAEKGVDSSEAATDFSSTNIQVEGVDEADILKNDGKYIYAIANGKLFIVEAYPAESAKIIATVSISGANPIEMFISKDSKELLLFSRKEYSYEVAYSTEPSASKMMIRPDYYPYYGGSGTSVQLFDISNKEKTVMVKEVEFEGSYLTSRLVGNNAYFVINSNPRYYYGDVTNSSGSTEENNIIPLMRIDGEEEQIAMPTEIGIMPRVRPQSFVTIASINLKSQDLTKETVVGSAQNLFASTSNIYLADQIWDYSIKDNNSIIPEEVGMLIKSIYYPQWNATQKTVINKFHFDEGEVSFVGAGIVPGNILNQFSMDEYKDNFRIATTVEAGYSEFNSTTSNRSTNNVYVLNKDMNLVGSLEGIAPDEIIYSVRFMGDKGYMVTFKHVDPLFVMDLSDPQNPKILGKLKIPGYSDYLHPIDETHLLGIGKDANELEDAEKVHSQGAVYYTAIKGIKMAIFDVSDVEHPIELAKYIIGDRGTESEALTNHKAILFNKEKELLVFPITVVENKTGSNDYYGMEQSFQGAVVMNVSLTDGFSERGRITHVSTEEELKRGYYYDSTSIIRRSLFMDNVLYTFSNKMIQANNLIDLTFVNGVKFPATESKGYYYPEMMVE
jgi:inhibitor of cysteine peptidase